MINKNKLIERTDRISPNLEKQTVLFPEAYTALAGTAIDIINQMERCNAILSTVHDQRLNAFASMIIFDGIIMETIASRIVDAYRFFDLSENGVQLEFVDRKSINDKIMAALTIIKSAKMPIDALIGQIEKAGEEIQLEMKALHEWQAVPTEFENILSAIAPIISQQENAVAVGGSTRPTIADNEIVDYVRDLNKEDEVLQDEINVESIPANVAHVIWRAQRQYVKSVYAKIQAEILQDAAYPQKLTWVAEFFHTTIKYLLLADLLADLLIANLSLKNIAITKDAYDNVIQAAARSSDIIEKSLHIVEQNLKESRDTASEIPLDGRMAIIDSVCVTISTELDEAVVSMFNIVHPNMVEFLNLQAVFQTMTDELDLLIEKLTDATQSERKSPTTFLKTVLKITQVTKQLLGDIAYGGCSHGWNDTHIYQKFFTIIYEDFLVICSAIESIVNNSLDWENEAFLPLEQQREQLHALSVGIWSDSEKNGMHTAYRDMISANNYSPNMQYINELTNWNKNFYALFLAMDDLMISYNNL